MFNIGDKSNSAETFGESRMVLEDIESTFADAFVFTFGKSILKQEQEVVSKFLSTIYSFDLHMLFNANVVSEIETIIVNNVRVRDFVLNTWSNFKLMYVCKHPKNCDKSLSDFNAEMIRMVEYCLPSEFYPNLVEDNQDLRNRIQNIIYTLQTKESLEPKRYLRNNTWYIVIVFMNLWYMKLVDSINSVNKEKTVS